MPRTATRKAFLALIASLCLVGGLLLIRQWRSSADDAEWLSSRPGAPRSKLEFLGRWMWPVKRQLAPLRQRIFGAPTLVDLRGIVVEIDPARPPSLPAPTLSVTNDSGEALFVFSDPGVEHTLKAAAGVQVLTTPRMTVANRMQAQIAITQSAAIGSATNIALYPVGWWVDVWPSARGRAVELACFITSTERAFRETGEGESLLKEAFVRTNVAFGARAIVPMNGTLFLLSRGTNQNGKVIGVLLSPGILKK